MLSSNQNLGVGHGSSFHGGGPLAKGPMFLSSKGRSIDMAGPLALEGSPRAWGLFASRSL